MTPAENGLQHWEGRTNRDTTDEHIRRRLAFIKGRDDMRDAILVILRRDPRARGVFKANYESEMRRLMGDEFVDAS